LPDFYSALVRLLVDRALKPFRIKFVNHDICLVRAEEQWHDSKSNLAAKKSGWRFVFAEWLFGLSKRFIVILDFEPKAGLTE